MGCFAIWSLIYSILIGIVVGISELLSRYPETKYLFKSAKMVSIAYILFNGLISIIALFILWYFKDQDAASLDSVDYGSVLIAGFGGMMILRSSLFSVEVKGKPIEIGLVQIVNVFLKVIERKIRNKMAPDKLSEVADIIDREQFINFAQYNQAIVKICANFTYHFDNDDTLSLQDLIKDLNTDGSMTDREKMIILGGEICKYCDVEMFGSVIKVLKKNNIEDKSDYNKEIEELIYSLSKEYKRYGKKE